MVLDRRHIKSSYAISAQSTHINILRLTRRKIKIQFNKHVHEVVMVKFNILKNACNFCNLKRGKEKTLQIKKECRRLKIIGPC